MLRAFKRCLAYRSLTAVGYAAIGCASVPIPIARGTASVPGLPPARFAGRTTRVGVLVHPPLSPGPADLPPDALLGFGAAPFARGSLHVEQVSSDGRWLSVCRAREESSAGGGADVSPLPRHEHAAEDLAHFLITPQEELTLDGVMGSDPTGRFVLISRGESLLLWDNERRTSLDLAAFSADARLSAESFAELRSAAFDAVGRQLLYVRAGDSGERVVIRDLVDDSERAFDPGPGLIWRARLDPGGSFIVLEMLTDDSNGNGRLDFPAPLLRAPRPCDAAPLKYHAWAPRGDRPETVLLSLDAGIPIHEPDLLYPVGNALLLRDAAGALVWKQAGKRRVLEPPACKGRIVHADAVRQLFVVGCMQTKKTGHVSLDLVTLTEHRPLGLELATVELDREPSDSPRLVALYPGADTVLLDVEKLALIPLKAGDSVIATHAARALVRRGNELLIYDAETLSELPLTGPLDPYPRVLLNMPYAFVSPLLVDLDAARVAGVSRQRPLALSKTGQLLLSASEPDAAGWLRGPLHWLLLAP